MSKTIDFEAAFEPEPQVIEPEVLPPKVSAGVPVKYDTRPVILSLIPFEEMCQWLGDQANAVVINDEKTYVQAVNYASDNKKLARDLEKARKEYVDPHVKFTREINNLFRRLTDRLDQNLKALKRKMADFNRAQEIERQRQEKLLREEQQKLQEKMDAEAKELETEAPQLPPVSVEMPKMVRAEKGAAYQKKKWKCRIEFPDLVPREYCDPSQKKLDEAVRGGLRKIPGCIIEEEIEMNVRV